MGSSLSGIALKALGAVLAALLVLSVVGTIVGLIVGFVTTIVLLAVTTVALVLFLGFSLWLASTLLSTGGESMGRGAEPLGRSSDRNDASETASRSWRDRLPGGGRDAANDDRDEAERLRERYVAGEIDEAEFERRLALLLETSDPTESSADRRTGTSNRDESFRDRLFE